MSRATAIIVAAGAGERLGVARPKALVPLAGEPLVLHSVRAFAACPAVGEILVVAPPEHLDAVSAALDESRLDSSAEIGVCSGGRTRSESVDRGLEACSPRPGLVAVHDAARPLVTAALIERALAALASGWDAVAPALPIVDTLKLVDPQDQSVVRTVDREDLWAVQTPQVFERATLERAHDQARGAPATDDLALVEQMGGRVRLIIGERRNLKVTYADDLLIAEALLAHGGSSERA